jgi:hypothetical protein
VQSGGRMFGYNGWEVLSTDKYVRDSVRLYQRRMSKDTRHVQLWWCKVGRIVALIAQVRMEMDLDWPGNTDPSRLLMLTCDISDDMA